jgi:hypothetical protein
MAIAPDGMRPATRRLIKHSRLWLESSVILQYVGKSLLGKLWYHSDTIDLWQ